MERLRSQNQDEFASTALLAKETLNGTSQASKLNLKPTTGIVVIPMQRGPHPFPLDFPHSKLLEEKSSSHGSHICCHFPFYLMTHLTGELKRKHVTEVWRSPLRTA